MAKSLAHQLRNEIEADISAGRIREAQQMLQWLSEHGYAGTSPEFARWITQTAESLARSDGGVGIDAHAGIPTTEPLIVLEIRDRRSRSISRVFNTYIEYDEDLGSGRKIERATYDHLMEPYTTSGFLHADLVLASPSSLYVVAKSLPKDEVHRAHTLILDHVEQICDHAILMGAMHDESRSIRYNLTAEFRNALAPKRISVVDTAASFELCVPQPKFEHGATNERSFWHTISYRAINASGYSPKIEHSATYERSFWHTISYGAIKPLTYSPKKNSKGRIVETAASARERNELYKDFIADAACRLATQAFRASPMLSALRLSFMRPAMSESTGHLFTDCILSVDIDRDTFLQIAHRRVRSENALRNFPLRFSYDKSMALKSVHPFPPYIGTRDTSAVDLNNIDPTQFEHLIRQLLERMGYIATLTKSSHDGGIDVEAVNPQPIVGGKLVVQCKRYAGVIGSPIIRDLYGACVDAGASKGILITTSHFSPDAIKFADGKPLELIDRAQLVSLLRAHGLLA
jgi:HJR/Mrr/RecB family endonuclease